MPKLVLISDTHLNHRALPPGDILVHAGDACASGSGKDWVTFCAWWNKLDFKHKVFVAGNHDRVLETMPTWALAELQDTYYLQDSGVRLEGLEFYGTPWQRPFCDWAFNLADAPRREKFEQIPACVEVLVTHTPPCGIQDTTREGGDHFGDEFLREVLCGLSPQLHVFGHIHGGYGVRQIEDYLSVNAAQCDERYRAVNPPVVVEL
jgi:Icc-related predicted phosphoesterase